MKKVFLETGQRFFESVLAWLQDGKEESDVNRRNDFSDAGILSSIGEDFDIIIGDNNNPPTTHSINVRPGVAYDSNGERIEIIDPITAFDPSAPTATSPDGKGGTVLTPLSTGSQNITLTANSLNFIWVDYLAIRDTSEFTLHKITNTKQYFKQDDGFQITVTTVDVAPTLASLKLGSVDLTGGGIVSAGTISLAGRIQSGIKLDRTKIKVGKFDRSDATLSYNHEDELFLDDHVKGLGTGILSEKNVHALAPLDIGLNTEEILETHQKFMHSNGIVGDVNSITSSLFLEFVPITPGEDFVRIKLIDTAEIALVDGITITNADIPSDVTLLFSSVTDPTNTYYVFINKNTKQVQRSDVNPAGDNTKLSLWSFTWTANLGAPNDGNITNIVDLRDFSLTVFPLLAPDGSASDPVYSFNKSQSTGLYSSGTDKLAFSTNGSFAGEVTAAQRWLFNGGSSALPILSFFGDEDTGIHHSGSDTLDFSADGITRMTINTNQVQSTVPFRTTDAAGSESLPDFSFTNDNDTGMFRSNVDVLGFSVGGNSFLIASGDEVQIRTGFRLQTIDAGSAADPIFQRNSDSDTGIFWPAADQMGFSTNSTERLRITNSALQILNSVIINTAGSASNPSYAFFDDIDTGMYNSGTNQLSFSTGTVEGLKIDSAQDVTIPNGSLTVTTGNIFAPAGVLRGANGSPGSPTFSFDSNTNTGMYRITTDELGLSTGSNLRLRLTNSAIDFKQNLFKNGVAGIETVDIRDDNVTPAKISEGVLIHHQTLSPGAFNPINIPESGKLIITNHTHGTAAVTVAFGQKAYSRISNIIQLFTHPGLVLLDIAFGDSQYIVEALQAAGVGNPEISGSSQMVRSGFVSGNYFLVVNSSSDHFHSVSGFVAGTSTARIELFVFKE